MSGPTHVVLSNPTGFTRSLDRGTWVGCASQATSVEPTLEIDPPDQAIVNIVKSSPPKEVALRTKALAAYFQDEAARLTWQQRDQLFSLLCEFHEAFALGDGERGETGMVQLDRHERCASHLARAASCSLCTATGDSQTTEDAESGCNQALIQ